MIYVGIDDTDTLDTPGTNQLARALVRRLAPTHDCLLIVRHQLLFDPRVPYTSKNGSASILLKPRGATDIEGLIQFLRAEMLARFNPGSDPGLCVTASVVPEITEFGRRCQQDVVTQEDARCLGQRHGLHLEGLGGTEGGVIGALAAVGLAATGNDGRVVQLGAWPDDLSGIQDIATISRRDVLVREWGTDNTITTGKVDVGTHLRPNCRDGRIVLFVSAREGFWEAIRVP
jgi:hypothetical protein